MYGVDVVFELRKPPAGVQDCRVLVAFVPEWDSYVDALRDASAIVHSHVQDAFVDGWHIEALHMRFVNASRMEELMAAREQGFACEWYGAPCRVIQGESVKWFGGKHGG